MLGSDGSERANDAQFASEFDEFIDLLITQGERSTRRSSGFVYGPAALSPSLSFSAQDSSAAAMKFLVLGGDEQQQQQQQKRREGQGRQQGVYLCSRFNCGKRFERNNALQRHIASIHDSKGVSCPFCVSKKKFNRSDNFTRFVPTFPPYPHCLCIHFTCLGQWKGGGLTWMPSNEYVDMLPPLIRPSRGMTRDCWAVWASCIRGRADGYLGKRVLE